MSVPKAATRLFPEVSIEQLLAPFDHSIVKSSDGHWTVTVNLATATTSSRDVDLRKAAERAIKRPRRQA